VETEITITQKLTDGKTCNLVDTTIYEVNSEFATDIIENTQFTIIETVQIPNSTTVVTILPNEDYVVNVNGIEVSSGNFPVYGNATIDINL
jgi:aspartyl-tRNA synthetase